MSRKSAPALVSMDGTPLHDLLLEERPRVLKQDLDSGIHIVPFDDLHIAESLDWISSEQGALLSVAFAADPSSVASTSSSLWSACYRSAQTGSSGKRGHPSLLCSVLRLAIYARQLTQALFLCADISIALMTGRPAFSISVLLPRNLSSQLEMKSLKLDLSLPSSVSSSSFGGMRVSVMKALHNSTPPERCQGSCLVIPLTDSSLGTGEVQPTDVQIPCSCTVGHLPQALLW